MRESKRTASYCFMFIAAGFISGALGPSLIYLTELVSASLTDIATVFTARALGNMIGALIAGSALDRIKGHHFIGSMLILAVISVAIVPFASSLTSLLIIFAVMGFAEAAINTGGNLMMLWLHRDQAGSAVSLLHLCYSLGNMIAPLILIFGAWLTGSYGMGYGLIALYSLIFPFVLLRQKSPTFNRKENTGRLQIFSPVFYACFLFFIFLYVGFEITIAGWISSYAQLIGINATQAALLVTWFYVALSSGRLLSVPLLHKIKLTGLIGGLLSLCIVSTILLNIQVLPLTLVVMLLGLSCSALFPMVFTYANKHMSFTGKLTGFTFVCCGLGAMIVPSLTGPLIGNLGAHIYPITLLVLSLLLSVSWITLNRLQTRHLIKHPN